MSSAAARLAGAVALIMLVLTASADARSRRVSSYGGTFAYSWGPQYTNFNQPLYAGCPMVGEPPNYLVVPTKTFSDQTVVTPLGSWSYRGVARSAPDQWCLSK